MTTKQKAGLFDAFKKSKRSAPSALVSKSAKKGEEAKQQQAPRKKWRLTPEGIVKR